MRRRLVVMKFGGTSVADPEKIQRAADRAIQAVRRGVKVVVVVSAPGRMTDELLGLARQISPRPESRELDMLLSTGEQMAASLFAIAVLRRGHKAVSLTGPQAGILADASHTRARILQIRPKKVVGALSKGNIVAVAGFQGLNPQEDIATLGRGGSDLTAVALAAALKSERCEIYTDVRGVYTADPRVVPEARLIRRVSYDEMLELAGAGAQVMQSRSIEVAKKFRVPIRVASAFEASDRGTWIMEEVSSMEEVLVTGVALDLNQVKVTLRDVPDTPGMAAVIFSTLGEANVNVDMIIQSAARGRTNDISFTVSQEDLDTGLKVLRQVQKRIRSGTLEEDPGVAKVSVVGVGMRSHSGVAGRMFKALADNRINIQMISTSEIKISCIVDQKQGAAAVRCLHRTFGLHRPSGR